MFELFVLFVFVWLFVKAVGLAFRVTWGMAKVVAVILFTLALPALIGCFLITGGMSWAIMLLLYPLINKIGLIGGNIWKE